MSKTKVTTVKKFKQNNKVIMYIQQIDRADGTRVYTVNTGKPSDRTCLSWTCQDFRSACELALPQAEQYCEIFGGHLTIA